MRRSFIGLIIGVVVGAVLGITVLTPNLESHSASKSVISERDLEKTPADELTPILSALNDGDVIHWRSAPPYPSDRPNVAAQAKTYAKQLAELSGDKIILPVLAAKDVIAPDRLFAAIASGRIDALFTTADIAVDKESALHLFSAIPFGPKPADTLAWLHAGNGTERLKDIFAKHNINALICGYLPPEASGWFVKELNSAADIEGLRIRVSGLGAKVWEKAGAEINTMSPENILSSFDQDKLDGAVFSTPSIDAKSGISAFAKTYYFPGWQNQGQPLLLLLNARAWKRLDQERQSLIKASCDQQTTLSHAHAAKIEFDGLSELTKQQVILRRMPSYILAPLNEAWKTVLSEEARRNKTFRETWEDLNGFVETRRTWEEMGYLQNLISDY